jgi:hypothetical protein
VRKLHGLLIPLTAAVLTGGVLTAGALTSALVSSGPASAASSAGRPAGVVVHGGLTPEPGVRVPPLVLPRPRQLTSTRYQSSNWSGYVALPAKGVQLTAVSTTFTVPSLNCGVSTPGVQGAWVADWVGLDGFNTGSVEQEGVEAVCQTSADTPQYLAFYEMYPAAQVAFRGVNAGDAITVATGQLRNGQYHLSMSDLTNGAGFSVTLSCPAKANCRSGSAEVIAEAPTTDGSVDPLADFGLTTFAGSLVSANFRSKVAFSARRGFSVAAVDMVKSNGSPLATVGPLFGGEDFSDTWKNG